MPMYSSRFIVLDDLQSGDEIEIEASKDAATVAIRKGTFEFILPADEFSDLIGAAISVDRWIDRQNQRKVAN